MGAEWSGLRVRPAVQVGVEILIIWKAPNSWMLCTWHLKKFRNVDEILLVEVPRPSRQSSQENQKVWYVGACVPDLSWKPAACFSHFSPMTCEGVGIVSFWPLAPGRATCRGNRAVCCELCSQGFAESFWVCQFSLAAGFVYLRFREPKTWLRRDQGQRYYSPRELWLLIWLYYRESFISYRCFW